MRIVGVFLSNSTLLKFMDSSNTDVSPRLPITLNSGANLDSFDTGVVQTSGSQYVMKVMSERGNVRVGFWPTLALDIVSLSRAAILAQGAGFLALDFNSFRAYNTTTPPSTGCNPLSAGCQLTPWPGGVPAYTLTAPVSTGRYIVYSANLTNVDPDKRSLTLDSDSLLVQFLVPKGGGGTSRSWTWGIGRVNATTGVTQAWSTITITYFETVTVYFIVIPDISIATNKWPSSGDFDAVFLYLHGTVGNLTSTTYGQNIPFVTTKYT